MLMTILGFRLNVRPEHYHSSIDSSVGARYFDDLVVNAEKQEWRDPLADEKARFRPSRYLKNGRQGNGTTRCPKIDI